MSELLQFWEKGKIRERQDGVSMGHAEALVFVCELKTGGTEIALCTGAPSWCKSQPQVWDQNKSKVSGRCSNVRLCYLAAFTLRRNTGVGEACSSIYGDQVVTFSILHN